LQDANDYLTFLRIFSSITFRAFPWLHPEEIADMERERARGEGHFSRLSHPRD
jgi:hypothetical protein